jgi:hypothetical protein
MKKLVRMAPPNSMFFFQDSGGGKYPEIDQRLLRIWATESCVIVATLAFMDGETELIVSDEDTPPSAPAFEAMLKTPSKVIEVFTSENETLMLCDVPNTSTRVRVWGDHPSEPEHIFVALG